MTITKNQEVNKILLSLEGRLDTTTAPSLEAEISGILSDINELVLDLNLLDYLSSAGLRVILMAQKKMSKQGRMSLINVNETIMEVFEITGFSDILTIE